MEKNKMTDLKQKYQKSKLFFDKNDNKVKIQKSLLLLKILRSRNTEIIQKTAGGIWQKQE